jgi:hypothetical protein
MKNVWWAKTLRILAIVMMSLTSLFTLLGGAGTTCVALNPTGYGESFAPIAKYQWLYILFVIVTIAIGVLGVRAVVMLVKGSQAAYRTSLIALVLGIVVGAIHMAFSRSLRGGSSMPVDMVVYTTVITLLLFLLLRIPGIWQRVNFDKPAGKDGNTRQAAAFALFACGLLSLTIQFLMAPTHTIAGINYADVWHTALTLIGLVLVAGAAISAVYTERLHQRRAALATTR